MNRGKKWTALAVMMSAMLVFLAACAGGGSGTKSASGNGNSSTSQASANNSSSGSGSSKSSKDASNQPEITLTVFDTLANYAGIQSGWFGKLIDDKFHIKLNIIAPNLAGGEQKIATQMASGDLGDIVVGVGGKDYADAIKAGLLLDWNKNGLLDKYGQDIKKAAPEALKANSQQYGGGTAIYGVGHDVGSGSGPNASVGVNFGPLLRWDYYQQMGSPKLQTLDDFLPLLKKMQQAHPKSDSGKPTYGFTIWSDWDGDGSSSASAIAQFSGWQVTDGFNGNDMILTKVNENKWQGLLADNSAYMQALKFYHDANKMGLLDPDSLTQKFADAMNKFKDGQILFSQFPWLSNVYNTPEHTAEGKGYAYVPYADEKMQTWGFNPYGGSRIWAIGAHTKYPKRVMQFLDWLYSPEGLEESNYGPKGMLWDLDSNGKPELTDLGYKALPANEVVIPKKYGGGNFKDGMNALNNSTIVLTMTNPDTGEPYNYQLWSSYLKHQPDPVTKSWRDAMGSLTESNYVIKHGLYASTPAFFDGKAPAEDPADIHQERGRVGEVVKQYSWKMMMAKSDAEFNSLKQQMISKAKGLGYDDIVKHDSELYEKTVAKSYNK